MRGPAGERELIVIAKSDAGLKVGLDSVKSSARADVTKLNSLLKSSGARLKPLFGVNEDRVRLAMSRVTGAAAKALPDMASYYRVEADDSKLDDLANRLLKSDMVEAAYVKPPSEPPIWLKDVQVKASFEEAPPVTPDFISRQSYLDAAPGGIDARFAWTKAGGRGAGVRIIDIEGGWNFSHEDLLQNQGGVIGGMPTSDMGWRNHGTAVVGEFGGDNNVFGVTGICPEASVRAISIFGGIGSAGAIRQAADSLNPGDIILIELHRPGPRFNFQSRSDQRGYIAIEWWPDDFAAILYATTKRIIVVEAAGNGAEDLDDPIYQTRPNNFPATWRNPFNRSNPQGGAILVGAGAPPPNTHERNHGADRSRLGFSNFGSAIDVQGWGREVTTTGGFFTGAGDLQGGAAEDLWYTDQFSGTSSASPIVVGAVGCMQGALRGAKKKLLTPAKARETLRTTGSPQQDEPGRPATQRIGNRPNLREAIKKLNKKKRIKKKMKPRRHEEREERKK